METFGSATHPLSGTVKDIARASFRDEILEKCRPVLANELSDYRTPYMMKRSASQRLFEHVARNNLEKRLVPRVLNAQPDLIKARVKAELPPEVLEPLKAFCGAQTWSFDVRDRFAQQMDSAQTGLADFEAWKATKSIEAGAGGEADSSSPSTSNSSKPRRPEHHSCGFESMTLPEFTGSLKYGKPMKAIDRELRQLRYPTLQRAAKNLPEDATYRAHVLKSIRVLERQDGWDYESKLRAVETMKEVYENMQGSDVWREKLDDKIPLWVPSKRERRANAHHPSKYVQQVYGGAEEGNYWRKMRPFNNQKSLVKNSGRKPGT